MPYRLVLALLVFVNFYLFLGLFPLFNLDEGAFSEATREMLSSHNYITTYLNGELRFDKPILIYWLQALSAKIFGLNEFAMRLPSAIAASLWAMLIFSFTKRFFDEKRAFFATLFMVTSLQISLIAKAAIADALLNLFITLSMFSFYLYYQSRQKRYLYFTYAAIGFGVLTKGPVAILIPLAVSFLFLLRNLRFWLRSIFDPIGIAIFLVIALPWYLLEYLDQGEKFIEGFLLKHNISRFASKAMEGHRGSLFYYIPVLLIGLLPFTTIAIKAISKIKGFFSDPLTRFLAIWFLFVFIFFSFSHTKLPHYIIYGYTPLFILMALVQVRSKFLLVLPFLLFHLLFLALPFIKDLVLEHIKSGSYEFYIVQGLEFGSWYLIWFVVAIFAALWLLKKEFGTILVAMGAMMVISLHSIAYIYAKAAEVPIKEAALYAKEHNLTSIKMVGINTPSFSFYYENITPRTTPKDGDIIFTKRKPQSQGKILFKKGGIMLYKKTIK